MGKSSSKDATSSKNPLIIPEILCHVFEWLPTKDLKSCNLVCKTWNSVGRPSFVLKLTFSHKEEIRKKRVEKFAKIFSLSQNFECINSYLNIYDIEISGSTSEIEKSGRVFPNVQELNNEDVYSEGINLMLFDWPNKLFKCYDMSPVIARNITKLSITGCYNCNESEPSFTPIAISLDLMCESISALKALCLMCCQLRTTKNTPRLSLQEIDLNQVQLLRDGEKVNVANEIFDFTQTRKIVLKRENVVWIIILQMNDISFETFKNIYLSNVELRNWKTCKWNVKKLTVENIHRFNEPENVDICEMKVKELEFINCGKIHSSFLPRTIEKLQIALQFAGDRYWIESQCSNNLKHLENLKYLCLNGLFHYIDDEDSDSQLEEFALCSTLVEIHFGNNLFYIGESMIHSTMQKILLQPQRFDGVCAYDVGWEQFIVIQESFSCFAPYQINYLTKLNIGANVPRRVVISLPNEMDLVVFQHIFATSLIQELQKLKTVIIGAMVWSPVFESLGSYDEPSNGNSNKKEFFLFENNSCRKITENEFKSFECENNCGFCQKHHQMNFHTRSQTGRSTHHPFCCCV